MLTDAQIQGLKPPVGKALEVLDDGKGCVVGLRVKVGPSGTKSFIMRTRVGAKVKVITLGRYGSRFGLAQARKAARHVLADFEAGKDPSVGYAGKAKTQRETVRGLYEAWNQLHVAGLRSARDVRRIFDVYILPALGERLAAAVERKDVLRLVDSVLSANPAKPTPVMAGAVLAQLSSFFGWCVSRDVVTINPCLGVRKPQGRGARERVLSDQEIAQLWRATETLSWPFGDAVKLLMLTGARRSEVFGASWSEFDLEAKLWTLPSARAKNGKTHIVPLSPQVVMLLQAMPRGDNAPLLFPASNGSGNPASGISKMKRRLDGALGVDDWVLHDIRRTVATHMQRLGVRLEVIEAVLNHISGSRSGIVGVYQRHAWTDEKRHALDMWGTEVVRLMETVYLDISPL